MNWNEFDPDDDTTWPAYDHLVECSKVEGASYIAPLYLSPTFRWIEPETRASLPLDSVTRWAEREDKI